MTKIDCDKHEMVSLPGDGEDGLTAKICWRCLMREYGVGDDVSLYTQEEWVTITERKKMKHTPGPWFLNDNLLKTDTIIEIFSSSDEDGTAPIADVYKYTDDNGEAIANAKLIEKAPELFSALELVLQEADQDIYTDAPEFQGHIENLMKALASAQKIIDEIAGAE